MKLHAPRIIQGSLAFLVYALFILLLCVLFSWGIVWPILSVFDVPITYLYVITVVAYVFLMIAIILAVKKRRRKEVVPEKLPVKDVIEGVAKICPHCGTLAAQKSTKCPRCGAPLES